jgi:hypothetical protein
MKLFLILSCIFLSANAFAATKQCTCKCVVKGDDQKFTTKEGSGKDREEAGETLKKNLDKKKCELTPTCTGKCASDEEA